VTATPTATPSPTPAPATAHLWLAFPIPPDASGDRYPGTWFPYGATGEGRYHLHHGVDYVNPAGTPVLAAAAGTIIVAGNDLETVYGKKPNFYGNLIIQELDQRFQGQPVYVLYGHLSQVLVEVGQRVEPGDVVGLVGMTGVAIGNHLHLEVRLGGSGYEHTRNPVLWLQPEPGQGIIAGLVLDAQGQPIPEAPVIFFRAAEPDKWWRQIQTYGNTDKETDEPILVNPDDQLGENFALGYVPAGDYLVKVKIGEKTYVRPVTVEPGGIGFVLITPDN
jgi:murein DD-endopeptidase MepM/ murein hydrolase activator NlpD